MDGLRSIVALSRDSLRGVEPAKDLGAPPRIEWVSPKSLFVEDSYQRRMGEAGTRLIRGIVARFSWSKFKLPACVELPEWDNVRVCIDGQHTATAAASHPDVPLIPIMIVDGVSERARAASFVGHNRDRVALTAMAIFHAEVAAGEPDAIEVSSACKAAGVTIMPTSINLRERQAVGATIAVGILKAVIKRRGKGALVDLLKVLVAAERGPIKAGEVGAAEIVLSAFPDAGAKLTKVIASKTAEQWAAIGGAEVAMDKGGHRRKLPDAIASLWLRALNMRIQQRPPASVQKPAKDPEPKVAPPKHAAAEKPKHPAARLPMRLPPAPAPAPPPPPAEVILSAGPNAASVVQHGGVSIDLRTREVSHRGRKAVLSDDGVRLVAALARVQPGLLDESILVRKTFFGTPPLAKERLRDLVAESNRALAEARLEVKTFAVGRMLADLDA